MVGFFAQTFVEFVLIALLAAWRPTMFRTAVTAVVRWTKRAITWAAAHKPLPKPDDTDGAGA
ncbi:MAG TPA: hypothetical protein VFG73_02150 [Rhodanobacteraceae bacterium]|nr:hypothetical protein [Rhodanobacteraceae bacterium]